MHRESAVQFGATGNLEGVITYPDEARPGAPVLILLSAGMLHKVGPGRLHPVLARKMAAKGLHTLRFDMQGLGDSLPAAQRGTLTEQSRESICAAMDFMTRETGQDRFILGGLCSGAEDGFRAGSEDDRIVGLVLLDAHAYATRKHKIHRLWYRFRRKTLHLFGYYLSRNGVSSTTSDEAAQRFGFIELPDREWAEMSLQKMIDRGVKLLFVYSGSWEYYNYRDQFVDMYSHLDLGDAITIRYYGDQDHTITLRSDQDRLVSTIGEWFDRVQA